MPAIPAARLVQRGVKWGGRGQAELSRCLVVADPLTEAHDVDELACEERAATITRRGAPHLGERRGEGAEPRRHLDRRGVEAIEQLGDREVVAADDVPLAGPPPLGGEHVCERDVVGVDHVDPPVDEEWQLTVRRGDDEEAGAGLDVQLAEDRRGQQRHDVELAVARLVLDRELDAVVHRRQRPRVDGVALIGKVARARRPNGRDRRGQHHPCDPRTSRSGKSALDAPACQPDLAIAVEGPTGVMRRAHEDDVSTTHRLDERRRVIEVGADEWYTELARKQRVGVLPPRRGDVVPEAMERARHVHSDEPGATDDERPHCSAPAT